jgi:cation diffusion facilitator family transporter
MPGIPAYRAEPDHDHVFLGAAHARNESRTWAVVALTGAMMVAEIAAGLAFGSMALLADGFHMATHAGALAIAGLAYAYARRHARDPRFSFGTGKVGELAGFASAIALALVAAMIGFESALRLWSPVSIRFDEAIAVAVLGLAVNLLSAWLLHDSGHDHHGHGQDQGHGHGHHHGHDHDHDHDHPHPHDHPALDALAPADRHADHNLRSAYFHVLADALTSVLAITGLLVGRFYGWVWMDPAMGIVGALVIARWSVGLLRGAGAVLLDTVPDEDLAESIRTRLESDGDRVADLHLWRVGPGHMALIVSIATADPRPPAHYRARLAGLAPLSHVTVEVRPRAA